MRIPDRSRRQVRRGFVLPLALFALTVAALLAAALLDGSVHELRMARGDVSAALAQAAAETALSDALAAPPDSVLLGRPRGSVSRVTITAGADTATVFVQSLGNGMMRVSAAARSWSAGVRADAGSLAFVRIVPDASGPPGSLRFRRLPGWWWTQIP